jgi:hypothetical protein
MRALIVGPLTFLACFGALQAAYPWSTYYGNFEFGWWPTMGSYLLVAALFGVTAAAIAGTLSRTSIQSAALRGTACGLAVFALAVLAAFLFGPGGLNVPGTRIRGIFFSEWRFLNFLAYVAAPVSLLAAVTCGWGAWRQRQALR